MSNDKVTLELELDPETLAEIEEIGEALRRVPTILGDNATAPSVARLALRRGLDRLRQELLPLMRAPILVFGLEPGAHGEGEDR